MQSNQPPFEIEKEKEKMIIALEANRGNVTRAAKLAGITPQTHYRWRKEDERYESRTDSMKDICYRDIKENLIDRGLKMVEKGNVSVLIKMLGIFLKDLPEEMKILNRCNNVPMRASIRYVDNPRNPDRQPNIVWDGSKGKPDSGKE